jgi:predicted Rossmann fold nucleotide-binding protein DprA/Smf involved in DNA uptake
VIVLATIYPPLLKEIIDPPLVAFPRRRLALARPALAIVGCDARLRTANAASISRDRSPARES